MNSDKRKNIRVRLSSLVDYAGENKARARDISTSGIRIVAERRFDAGAPLLLTIPLEHRGTVRVIAKVVWSKGCDERHFENGLTFFTVRREDRDKIEDYISDSLDRTSERRYRQRREADITVNYSTKAETVTKNITHEGLCLVTRHELPVGKIIYISITLPGCEPMNVYGKVVWSREIRHGSFENGVEYWEIREEDENKLIDFFGNDDDTPAPDVQT